MINMYIAHHSGPLRVPRLTVNTFSTDGMYRVEEDDTATTRVITGYEVIRFGVTMIGEYFSKGREGSVTISSAVPGAQYRITAWALNTGTRRSATPVVEYVTTEEKGELHSLHKDIARGLLCIVHTPVFTESRSL